MHRSLHIALVCALTPLIAGLAIFACWVVTRWDWLMQAGMITIYGGLLLFLSGVLALAGVFDNPASKPSRGIMATWIAGILLALNFPIAGGVIAAVVAIHSCYVVTVNNRSPDVLENVCLSGGGCDVSLGNIPANGSKRTYFWIQTDGQLQFSGTRGGQSFSKTVDGYVTKSMGAHAEVTVGPGDTIDVTIRYGQGTD